MVASEPAAIVHSAFLELRAQYAEPALASWDQGRVMESLLRALTPWGVSLESMAFSQPSTKASEIKTSVELPHLATIISVGLGEVQLMRNDPAWNQSGETIAVAEATIEALRNALKVVIGRQEASVAIHLSVPDSTPRALIGRFLDSNAPMVAAREVVSYGVSLYREDGYQVIDTSRLYAGAMFVKIARVVDGDTPLEDLAAALLRDERELADVLAIRWSSHAGRSDSRS